MHYQVFNTTPYASDEACQHHYGVSSPVIWITIT